MQKYRKCPALRFKQHVSVDFHVCHLGLFFNPLVPEVQNVKSANLTLNLLLLVWFVKAIVDSDAHKLWALVTNGLEGSVLSACNIDFLQIINYIEVPKYPFGIDGLNSN